MYVLCHVLSISHAQFSLASLVSADKFNWVAVAIAW